jgi:hypothetical protein
MSEFRLQIRFTPEQVMQLHMEGANVIIGRTSTDNHPNIAWQVFEPLSYNEVAWKEEYGLYASTERMTIGQIISPIALWNPPVSDNRLYTLEPNGIISSSIGGGGASNSYTLQNRFRSLITAGLTQNATVNGVETRNHIVSAVPVFEQNRVVMKPNNTVFIWVQSDVRPNQIVTNTPSPITSLRFGEWMHQISVRYDSHSEHFVNNTFF